jgi:elongation factor G
MGDTPDGPYGPQEDLESGSHVGIELIPDEDHTYMSKELDRHLYRETVQSSGRGNGRFIRQRGAIGFYAHVNVAVRPTRRREGIGISWEATSNIPPEFASAVVEGVQDILRNGVVAGMEMVDVHATVENGSFHEMDSTADAFREAAMQATTEAIRQAQPVLMEGVVQLTAAVPTEFLPAVEETVDSSGGRLIKRLPGDRTSIVEARIPAPRSSDLLEKILIATDGRSTISLVVAGFKIMPEPPDTVEQWVPAQR